MASFSAEAVLIDTNENDKAKKKDIKPVIGCRKRHCAVDIKWFEAALNVWKDLRPINTLQDLKVSSEDSGAQQSFKEIIEDRIQEMKAWNQEKPRNRDFIITDEGDKTQEQKI